MPPKRASGRPPGSGRGGRSSRFAHFQSNDTPAVGDDSDSEVVRARIRAAVLLFLSTLTPPVT